MTTESPTAQSGPSDLDRLIRVGDLPAPITNPEAWPTGYADGFNDYARMVAQTAPTQSTPAGARDAVADAAVSLRGLAGVIRKHGTCAPSAFEVVAERLEALTGKADGGPWVHGHRTMDDFTVEATQPAATGMGDAEWTDDQCIAFMGRALRHVDLVGEEGPSCDEIRQGVKAALTSRVDGDES